MSNVNFKSKTTNPTFSSVFDVSPNEVWDLRNDIYIIDVRRADEYFGELGHVPGARHILLDTLGEHFESLPKDKPIVFTCRSGVRSAKASFEAASAGFSETYNMVGGMILWNKEGLETEGKS